MEEKLEKFSQTFLRKELEINIVEEIDHVKLWFLAEMLSKQKSFGFFQQSLRGLNIVVELAFKAFRYFIDHFHVAITEFIDQSR